ncbi:MAG: hypothetical protein ACKOWL_02260 [Sphingobacteriaceae bacterium]
MARYFLSIALLISLLRPSLAQVQKPKTLINFPEFSIALLDYEVGPSTQNQLSKNTKPALHLASIPGELPEGRIITIKSTKATITKLEGRYETGIFVTNDGVTCDLSYWKTYSAPLKALKKTSSTSFIFPSYSREERKMFYPIDINEWKQEVKSNCGDTFYNLIKANTFVNQGASEVAICRYTLKISGKLRSNGKTFSKLIYFDIPLD